MTNEEQQESRFTFETSLDFLGISSYKDRILKAGLEGKEDHHLEDYISIADMYDADETPEGEINLGAQQFTIWFKDMVLYAEMEWEDSESIFRCISAYLLKTLSSQNMDV